MKLTPQQQADKIWKAHNYYWNDEPLIAKQRIVVFILNLFDDSDYWNEVKKIIYEK